MSESKIQIKIGLIEFSGEGNQDWLSTQLDKILDKVPELLSYDKSKLLTEHEDQKENDSENTDSPNLSIVSIASKLSCKTGLDLGKAAAVYLHFITKKHTFSRADILQVMKKATGYYKLSYRGHLTSTLLALVKNEILMQSADDTYSIHVDKLNELKAVLTK